MSNNYFIEFCSNWNLKSYQSKNAIAKGIKKFINIIIALHATILIPSSLKLIFFFKSIFFIASHKILIKNANYLLINTLFILIQKQKLDELFDEINKLKTTIQRHEVRIIELEKKLANRSGQKAQTNSHDGKHLMPDEV